MIRCSFSHKEFSLDISAVLSAIDTVSFRIAGLSCVVLGMLLYQNPSLRNAAVGSYSKPGKIFCLIQQTLSRPLLVGHVIDNV
jgi:hypothetical protein